MIDRLYIEIYNSRYTNINNSGFPQIQFNLLIVFGNNLVVFHPINVLGDL